jgi:ABC-type multidrug transport system ATPase subunit
MINGEEISSLEYDTVARAQGYVAQQDTFLETLTVWQTLTFSALLRISDDIPTKDKLRR